MQPRLVGTTDSSATILWRKHESLGDDRFFKYLVYIQDGIDTPVYSTVRWANELPSVKVPVVSTVYNLLPNTTYTFYISLWQDINVTTYGNKAMRPHGNSKRVQATTSKL